MTQAKQILKFIFRSSKLFSLSMMFLVIPQLSYAVGEPIGLGGLAQNILEPVTFFSDFLQTACVIIGSGFVFASIVRYFEHRRSPLMVPISTVIFLLIAGLMLLAIPFLAYFNEHGLRFSLLERFFK